jgi:glycosyltransferase involved in cell wall biosynthesis
MELSVIICAHNPRPHYLRRVLQALRDQSLPKEHWEVVLVDNASQQPLAGVWDLTWHPHGRHVSEGELGLSAARLRGIAEARNGLLVFVDDDNVLDADYLAEVVRIKRDWPALGTWGSGAITPEFELEPSKYVERLVPHLALRQGTRPCWSNVFPCVEATPWGAGLCVRASVARAYRDFCRTSTIPITGRRGAGLLSGEDVEISYMACKLGYGMATFPGLLVTHLIPKERVSASYLLRIFAGTQVSNYLLSYKWKGLQPWSPLSAWGLLSVFKNVILRGGLERRMYLANVRAAIHARRIIASSVAREQVRKTSSIKSI